jgi:ParB/RepB/Spo0J family partition protein
MLEIDRIERWDRQPRKAFDDDSLTELSRSIAAQGILQPLVVRPNPQKAAYYLIVAGERRFRAAQLLLSGEDEGERSRVARLPCLIREMTESQAFAQALVENLQREDLSRLDVMHAVKRLRDEYSWSIREIARQTGRNASDLSKLLRIADDPEVAPLVAEELITPTAATALIQEQNKDLRGPVLEQIRAKEVRRGIDVTRSLAVERERRAAIEDPGVCYITHPVVANAPISVAAHTRRPAGSTQAEAAAQQFEAAGSALLSVLERYQSLDRAAQAAVRGRLDALVDLLDRCRAKLAPAADE